MARAHRIQFPGIVYHVFSRGNEKMDIYRDDLERKQFMKFLSDAKEEYGFKLYAYVLMSNHYHLLIEPCSAPLSTIMQILNSEYARYFNWKKKRTNQYRVLTCDYFQETIGTENFDSGLKNKELISTGSWLVASLRKKHSVESLVFDGLEKP